jgi:hypothetical protein
MKKDVNAWLFRHKWIFVILFISIIGYFAYNYEIRLILIYVLRIGIGLIIGCVIWSFTEVFTKKKWIKCCAVIFVLIGILTWYKISTSTSKVVRMKEDVMYILPSSKSSDIFDGSENDPNLKRDSIQ